MKAPQDLQNIFTRTERTGRRINRILMWLGVELKREGLPYGI